MISDSTIDQIKAKTNILDVVGQFVKLKKQSSNYVGLCPFHNEKTASFTVSPQKEMFKCFGCGKSGDAISFLMEHEKMNYKEAIKWLADRYHVDIENEQIKKSFEKPQPRLQKVSDAVVKYFETRGISNNTLIRFGITEAVEWMPKAKGEIHTICFNYYRDEDLVNIKFRGKNKDFKLAKDAEIIFYNLNAIKDEKTAVIVEGEIDCLTLHECGIYNVVSVPNGTPPPDKQGNYKPKLEYLDNCYNYFTDKEKIIIATDGDQVGNLLKEELARRLGKQRCLTVSYPEGCKDANEVLKKHGKEAVVKLIEDAKEYPIEGMINIDEVIPEVVDFYLNGYPTGAKTRIPGFDDLLSFMPGQMTIITGIPGSGKDEFLNKIMANLTLHEKWRWGIWEAEEPASYHISKLTEKINDKSFAFRRDEGKRITPDELEFALQIIKAYFFFIDIGIAGTTIDVGLAKMRELVLKYGINGFVFNPWNYLDHQIPEGWSETQYISWVLTRILNEAKACNVHVFIVAHPTKIQKNKGTGKYDVPTLYSISGSAHFFNKTHNGICVYRDFETNVVDVYVQKVKFSWLGKIGFCSFSFDTETRQYLPLNN